MTFSEYIIILLFSINAQGTYNNDYDIVFVFDNNY